MILTLGELAVRLEKWKSAHYGVAPPFWPLHSQSFESVFRDALTKCWPRTTDLNFNRVQSFLVLGVAIIRFDGPMPNDVEDPSE
jgi:hypothetical protein